MNKEKFLEALFDSGDDTQDWIMALTMCAGLFGLILLLVWLTFKVHALIIPGAVSVFLVWYWNHWWRTNKHKWTEETTHDMNPWEGELPDE